MQHPGCKMDVSPESARECGICCGENWLTVEAVFEDDSKLPVDMLLPVLNRLCSGRKNLTSLRAEVSDWLKLASMRPTFGNSSATLISSSMASMSCTITMSSLALAFTGFIVSSVVVCCDDVAVVSEQEESCMSTALPLVMISSVRVAVEPDMVFVLELLSWMFPAAADQKSVSSCATSSLISFRDIFSTRFVGSFNVVA